MEIKFMEDCKLGNREKKYFILFLIIHLVLWSVLPLIRHLLPVDAMEGIVWGGYFDFGTHKHPPLAGWITYFFYHIFNNSDYIIYLIGQICVLIGFLFTYKLAGLFMDKRRALCAVMVLEGCFTYSYMSIFDGFNPNFLIIALFPAVAFYFYKAINENKLSDWLIMGVFTGLAGLSKYQAVLIVVAMLLVPLICKKYRSVFLNYKLYLSVLIAGIVNLPHIFWLTKNDFFSWKYFEDPDKLDLISVLSSSVTFCAEQFCAVIGTLVIFFLLYWICKQDRDARNINFEDSVFILVMGCIPVILQVLLAVICGSRLIGTWGYPMLFMIGICLYYFLPVKISEKYLSVFIKLVYMVMGILFLVFFILFSVEKNFRSSYPYEVISQDFEKIYKQETGLDLKYACGYIEFVLPITIYDKTHPQIIFETYGHKNIWIDEDDVKKSGVLIISRHDDVGYEHLVPYESKNKNDEYRIYKFTIQNKLKHKRDYDLFYKIIPPVDKN